MRFLIILFSLFLLTGCNVEYKLNIDENLNFNEITKIESTTADDTTKIKEFNLYIPIDAKVDDYASFTNKIDTLNYYNFEKDINNMTFNYNFDKNNYLNSTIINNAYETVLINENENIITVSTSDEFLLFNNYNNLDKIDLTITSSYEFVDCNADVYDKHECIWTITKDNAYGKNIFLKLDTNKKNTSIEEKIKNNTSLNLSLIFFVLAIIALIIYKIIKKKGDLHNKI